VNKYALPQERPLEILRIPLAVETRQVERVRAFKQSREANAVRESLDRVREAARSDANLMPVLVEAVDRGCSVGEISDVYREVFGVYRDPAHL
jgi:methylmalonyl-CoA mutase N-terminal domain/subunit